MHELRPRTVERLDIGFEVMDTLLVRKTPLTSEQVIRYVLTWIDDDNMEKWDDGAAYLDRMVSMLSRTSLPLPVGVAAQVCMCSELTLKKYSWRVLHPIRLRVMDERIWSGIPLDRIPKFDNVISNALDFCRIPN